MSKWTNSTVTIKNNIKVDIKFGLLVLECAILVEIVQQRCFFHFFTIKFNVLMINIIVNLKSLGVESLCIVELLFSFGQFQQPIYE